MPSSAAAMSSKKEHVPPRPTKANRKSTLLDANENWFLMLNLLDNQESRRHGSLWLLSGDLNPNSET